MSYKHIFKLSDFCSAAQYIYDEFKTLESTIDEFLTKELDSYYAGNPFISLYIYGSKFNEGNLYYDSLSIEFNEELKIIPNYNLEMSPDLLTLKEYTLPLFNYLDNYFISIDSTNVNVIWWYSYDVDISKINDDAILSQNITSSMFYKNSLEKFNRIFITGDLFETPVKSYFLNNFNLQKSNIIECRVTKIKGDSFLYINGGISSFNNPIVAYSAYIDVINKDQVSELLNQDNVSLFIKRDLSNVEELYVKSDDIENESDNTVLSIQTINDSLKALKNINDYQINSSYTVENSYNGDDVLTAKKAISIIKTHIEEYYIQIINDIISEKQTTDIGRLIEYYRTKIEELENNYLLLKNHSLSGFYNRDDYCLEITNPITFKKQLKCVDSNVSIEISNRALTKGVLKRWLIQCINDRIPI